MKKQWDIYTTGDEAAAPRGTGRPQGVAFLVISSDAVNATFSHVTVLPLVGAGEERDVYPNEARNEDTVVLGHQIRTIRHRELTVRKGRIGDPLVRSAIMQALSVQLGMRLEPEIE
ncbi:MAG: type II toxin-antitoxin system PemK/MazF family toxin [Spirochaetaceae bacterium]|nr:MAG: type II toxin-antitoxin system PemK/MazF family toxin [Spirochaetaceae bacterium]